jgi:hypothetical protein
MSVLYLNDLFYIIHRNIQPKQYYVNINDKIKNNCILIMFIIYFKYNLIV